MTRFLSTGLRVITVAALTSGLTLSAMAQTTGSQPTQPGAQVSVKSAPAVEGKKDAMPATAGKSVEVKPTQPATGTQVQATGAAKPATTAAPATAAAPAKPAAAATGSSAAPAAPLQHDGKASITTEKKSGG